MRIDYTIVFDRSWRVGSGEAAGRALDSLIRRDAFGLPFVPGTTVRGLVRDAARKLTGALSIDTCDGTLTRRQDGSLGSLCGVNGEDASCPLCALAGSPHREPQVRWGPARLALGGEGSDGTDEKGEKRKRLAKEATLVPGLLTRPRPRTAIDAETGRAADEHLFTFEEAVEGLELRGSLDLEPTLPRREISLLVASLRFVREIGGNRRRGLGACRIRIDRANLAPVFTSWQEALQALSGEPGETPEKGPALSPSAAKGDGSASTLAMATTPRLGAGLPTFLQIDATVVGEVVAGGRPEAGNLIAGLTYLAGSTLRGALAARWREERGGEAFLRCFVSGRVRFGFLYPISGQEVARPTSLAKHTCKLRPGPLGAGGHGFVDLLLEPEEERCGQPNCRGRLVPWGPGFEGPGGGVAEWLAMSPHNRIEPLSQTVRKGSLFAYEALPEGTHLRGYLQAESSQDLADLLTGLGLEEGTDFVLRVGRRKGSLGHLECRISRFTGLPSGVGLYPDGEPVPAEWPREGFLRIDLVTPCIVVDEHLRYRESLTPRDLGLAREGFEEAFGATEVLAGWNSTHRLPKVDQVALAAGSSYLLAPPLSGGEEELAALARAAREGVGLRRAEGFGVIAVRAVELTGASR